MNGINATFFFFFYGTRRDEMQAIFSTYIIILRLLIMGVLHKVTFGTKYIITTLFWKHDLLALDVINSGRSHIIIIIVKANWSFGLGCTLSPKLADRLI